MTDQRNPHSAPKPTPTSIELTLSPSPFFSPLLAALPEQHRPSPLPACASCPASMWRTTHDRIECLCLTAGRVSWDKRQDATLFCDGREAAIARLGK